MMSLVAAATDPPAVEAPDVDLLLYLAEFEDANGDFVDPMSVTEDMPASTTAAPAPDTATDEEQPDEL